MPKPLELIQKDICYWMSETAFHLKCGHPVTYACECHAKAKAILDCLTPDERVNFYKSLPQIPAHADGTAPSIEAFLLSPFSWDRLSEEDLSWIFENVWHA